MNVPDILVRIFPYIQSSSSESLTDRYLIRFWMTGKNRPRGSLASMGSRWWGRMMMSCNDPVLDQVWRQSVMSSRCSQLIVLLRACYWPEIVYLSFWGVNHNQQIKLICSRKRESCQQLTQCEPYILHDSGDLMEGQSVSYKKLVNVACISHFRKRGNTNISVNLWLTALSRRYQGCRIPTINSHSMKWN